MEEVTALWVGYICQHSLPTNMIVTILLQTLTAVGTPLHVRMVQHATILDLISMSVCVQQGMMELTVPQVCVHLNLVQLACFGLVL